MFIKAIETAAGFTRAIHTISRNFGSENITPGAATLFFVNDEGYALTCKHVADVLVQSAKIENNYRTYKDEVLSNAQNPRKQTEIAIKYGLDSNAAIQLKSQFINCAEGIQNMNIQVHPDYDLALLKFVNFQKLNINNFPVFKKDITEIKQGKSLCRLGYPFPEFNNFRYNPNIDDIEWTKMGNTNSPQFPIDGMLTRFIGDTKGKISGIEMSTPGLRGQSGGPLFDENGIIYGMQSRTKHLHLGFDLENKDIMVNGQKRAVSDYSFLHLGECVHVAVIKDFLRKHDVRFSEG
ncbi:MAG: hypothetical protein ACI9IP_002277 [Arcticibacterium sp.]|jgi:hypothetical protein